MNTYVYIHVCCINHWKSILDDLLGAIRQSGLYEAVKEIRCIVLSENPQRDLDYFFTPHGELRDKKVIVLGAADNLDLCEPATLRVLHEHAFQEDFRVLYLHTKGVRHNGENPCVTDWVKYLTYFTVEKYETCLTNLETHDAVGVNFQDAENPHYSGNFWWSKSDHLRTLKPCQYTHYNAPEYWVSTRSDGKYACLWKSGVNHYRERYEPSQYR